MVLAHWSILTITCSIAAVTGRGGRSIPSTREQDGRSVPSTCDLGRPAGAINGQPRRTVPRRGLPRHGATLGRNARGNKIGRNKDSLGALGRKGAGSLGGGKEQARALLGQEHGGTMYCVVVELSGDAAVPAKALDRGSASIQAAAPGGALVHARPE